MASSEIPELLPEDSFSKHCTPCVRTKSRNRATSHESSSTRTTARLRKLHLEICRGTAFDQFVNPVVISMHHNLPAMKLWVLTLNVTSTTAPHCPRLTVFWRRSTVANILLPSYHKAMTNCEAMCLKQPPPRPHSPTCGLYDFPHPSLSSVWQRALVVEPSDRTTQQECVLNGSVVTY